MDQVNQNNLTKQTIDFWQDARQRFWESWPTLVVVMAITAVLLGGILVLHFWKGIPIAKLTRDPNGVSGLPAHTGMLSQVGIFFWAAAPTICLFSTAVLTRRSQQLPLKRFLTASALLILLLAFDELFMLHEVVWPRLGVPEKVVLSSYIGLTLLYLLWFYPVILQTTYPLLFLAFVFFGLSVLLDVWELADANLHYFLEDGTKLAGLVSWTGYFFQVGLHALQGMVPEKSSNRFTNA